MKRAVFVVFAVILGTLVNSMPVMAETLAVVTQASPDMPLIFSEVYANGQNNNPNNTTDEADSEFIEIYNRSTETVDLAGYTLSRQGSSTSHSLSGQLAAGGYLAIHPSFILANSGGTVTVANAAAALTATVTYTNAVGADEAVSYQLTDSTANVWQALAPTPNQQPALPPVETPEEPPIEPEPSPEPTTPATACSITDVHLSEIVANPTGSDSAGGEFVEFYNAGNTEASLEGCTLTSDKMTSYTFAANDRLAPKAYYALNLADKLLNGGGTVTFQTATYEEAVQYSELGDNEAWVFLSGSWQQSSLATPNAPNQLSPGKGAGDEEVTEAAVAAPCAAGKYRNPETGRCKNVEAPLATVTPCEPGKVRNPETNRCRNAITTASASLTACAADQERNPETNRCRKVATTASALTACKEGYERNTETNRCRKVSSPASNTAHIEEAAPKHSTQDFLIIGIAVLAIGGFLIYEYRHALGNFFKKFLLSRK